MIIKVEANQCDVCSHIWLAPNPTRCAKCKTRQWNTANPTHKEPAPTTRIEASTHTVYKPRVVPTVPEEFDEPNRIVHDPIECQDRGCKDCRKLRQQR